MKHQDSYIVSYVAAARDFRAYAGRVEEARNALVNKARELVNQDREPSLEEWEAFYEEYVAEYFSLRELERSARADKAEYSKHVPAELQTPLFLAV